MSEKFKRGNILKQKGKDFVFMFKGYAIDGELISTNNVTYDSSMFELYEFNPNMKR